MYRLPTLCVLALVTAPAIAQLPTPNPIPRTSPRASWVLTPGVTGTPSQRRDNPGAASADRMYLFGGRLGNATSTVLNALYEFDGSTWTVRTAEGAPGAPPARGGACVAWDFANDRLVVFGGDDGTNLFGDTWTWDPTTNAWTNVTPAQSPAPRRWAAMAYDPSTQGMILFGGETATSPPTPTAETWLFIGGSWVQLSPNTSPPARGMHSLCTRDDFGDVFLCSGRDSGGSTQIRHLDAWRWSGADWVQLPTNGTIPHGTTANQAVYDPLRKRIVLQGGQGISVPNTANGGIYGDLYGGSPSNWCSEYDCLTEQWVLYGAASWNTGDPVIGRASRYYAAFLPSLGKVFKVGGQNPAGIGTTSATCDYQASPVASATPIGAGCTGGGGVVGLEAVSPYDRPWLGRRYDFRVTNLASGSLVIAAIGFTTTSLPLSALLPEGGAGCNLEVALDVTWQVVNIGGTAASALLIPDDAALVGASLHHQALQLELTGPVLSLLTSSNALTMTFGAL